MLNDDGNWALAHLKQAQDYIILLDKQMIKTNKKISELNNIITSTDDFNNTVLLINKLYDFANVGFDANFTRDLKNLNLTDREIQKSKDFIKREFNIDNQDFIKNLNTFLSTRTELMTNINDLSINITNVINTLENDPEINSLDIPISDPGLQYNGTTDSSIIFDGRNSFSKLSQVKKFEWDLNGDGNFSDAIGPIVSYNYDKFFNGFIGLKVTNDFGYSDIGYSQINITSNPNIFNNISFQPDPSVDLHVNNSSIFKVTGSNRFIKSMEWYLDDKLISSGNSFNYLPDKDDFRCTYNYIKSIICK